jgi:CRISPR system Cascade subunit CasD
VTALVLRLAGPLQAWGSSSRFVRRTTEPQPTKSGVLGLLAAALGRRRTDPIEDLLGLRFGVRIDQPGQLVRDFQTARSLDGQRSMPLSYRYYLADAVFLAVVEGEEDLIRIVDAALRRPTFPLYLGRRSCPPAGPLVRDVREEPLWDVLETQAWSASEVYRRRTSGPVRLEVVVDSDAAPESARRGGDVVTVRDTPISFDPERREYGWRDVVRTWVELDGGADDGVRHNGMSILGG